MKKIAVLGSTGSIGTQTLEIVRTNGDIEVEALAAGNNIDLLERQIREFSRSWQLSGRRKGRRNLKPPARYRCEDCLRDGRSSGGGGGSGVRDPE